jgi:hypothetical protein
MRPIAILAVVLAGAACAPVTPPSAGTPGAAQAGAAAPAASPAPACQTTTVPVTVGGRAEQATIEACPQPDGSWRITQTTPGLPPQVYVMPAPPGGIYPAGYPDYWDYSDYWPYWDWGVGGPWFWGIGPTVVIVEHFHHFHGRPGFAHAMAQGFGHPMGGGGMRR